MLEKYNFFCIHSFIHTYIHLKNELLARKVKKKIERKKNPSLLIPANASVLFETNNSFQPSFAIASDDTVAHRTAHYNQRVARIIWAGLIMFIPPYLMSSLKTWSCDARLSHIYLTFWKGFCKWSLIHASSFFFSQVSWIILEPLVSFSVMA